MIYPQGKTIHQNLSAEYTDVPKLLSTLEGNGFSGVVEIEGGGKKGVFFIATGQMVNAVIGVDSDPPAMIGDHAVPELLALARQPQGLLHVFELTAAQVELATGPLRSELVFKDLSTDFIRMDQFVRKLGDDKHTGYMEIVSKDNKQIGTLSFRNGDVVGLQAVSESGQTTLFEGEAIPSVLDNAVRHGAVFNVYRSAGVTGAAGGMADSDPHAEDQAAPKAPVPPARPKREPKPVSEPLTEVEKQEERIPEGPAVEKGVSTERLGKPAASAQLEVHAEDREMDETSAKDRRELIAALERILSKLESFIDHVSKRGEFLRVFRQTCVDGSDIFHFLDPFEGQFEYDSGKIRTDDTISSDDLAVATAYCLNLVLTGLNKEFLRGAALPPGLKGEIESAFRHYKEAIRNSGLPSVVPANMR